MKSAVRKERRTFAERLWAPPLLCSLVQSRWFIGVLFVCYSVMVCLFGWSLCMQCYAVVALWEETSVSLYTDRTAIFLCLLFGTSEGQILRFWTLFFDPAVPATLSLPLHNSQLAARLVPNPMIDSLIFLLLSKFLRCCMQPNIVACSKESITPSPSPTEPMSGVSSDCHSSGCVSCSFPRCIWVLLVCHSHYTLHSLLHCNGLPAAL